MSLVKRESLEATLVEPGLYGVRLIDGRHGAKNVALIRGWMIPGASHSAHTHDVDEVIVFLSGNAIMEVGGRSYDVRPGDAIHVPAHTVHSSVNNGAEDLCFVSAFADNLIASNPLDTAGRPRREPLVASALRHRLAWVLRRLAARLVRAS